MTTFVNFIQRVDTAIASYKLDGKLEHITDVNLSTMTIHTRLHINSPINLGKFQTSFNQVTLNNGVTWKLHRSKTKNGEFFNQITLCHKDHSNKKVKIFSNGTFHITGVVNETECLVECVQAAKILKGWKLIDVDEIRFAPLTINLINTNYEYGFDINLTRMQQCLRDNPHIMECRYNPEKYPGLNIKICVDSVHRRRVTILMFRSGNLMITGGKSYDDILFAFNEINNIVSTNYDAIFIRTNTPKKKKKTIACGYI